MGTRVLIKKIVLCALILSFCRAGFAQSRTNFEFFLGSNTSEYQNIVVKKVISADVFTLESGEKIKLIGLRAPEPPKIVRENVKRDEFGFVIKERKNSEINLEEDAFYFVQNLLEGKHVRLEFDAEKKDIRHRTFAYAFFLKSNIFINAEILRNGFSYLQIRPPNTKYAEELRKAYREARQEKRGIQGE